MIGLDTTAIIDFFKKDKAVLKALNNLNEPLASTIINYQEIIFGIDLDNSFHLEEEKYYSEFFDKIFVFPLDLISSKKAARIFWKLKKQGNVIGRFDCMIAGIFIFNGVDKILTKNVRHFNNIKGLKVISY